MHFGIIEKWTSDCVSQYNTGNAGLISKVYKKQPAKTLKIALPDNPTVVWCPPKGTSANICRNLTPPKLKWPTFLPLIVWFYFHSNFCGGLRNTHLFFNRGHVGHSRSSRVVDFGTNLKSVCDFLLVLNSNFGPILHCFSDTATYWLKIPNFSNSTLT